VLGEYLGHKNCEPVLRAFVRRFDFSGRRIDEALRMLLESFRLPGESQQIERVMNSFASVYYAAAAASPDGSGDASRAAAAVASEDAAFVLAYSIIMLNTDQVRPCARQAQAGLGCRLCSCPLA
jgi:golgi-specific brefeldin A-resistance guanine nucleotide exchange factor 1